MPLDSETDRHLGLLGATGVGVGAIVGGGILALAGTAFAQTGPSAMVAFGLNGIIAMLTALSFAEMASKFPESGGTYTFAKRVLSLEAAFTVGWVVWFASIVAAVLYAIGFAQFGMILVSQLWPASSGEPPEWLTGPTMVTAVAIVTTAILAASLMRRAAGGGHWANVGKVLVFGVLIVCGLAAVAQQPLSVSTASLRPFFVAGFGGLIQAMGYTFIALQGFDLIAAVGGEVKEPAKTLPRAMILSLAIALLIYLPLLFVIITVGAPGDRPIAEVAAEQPDQIVAIAAQNYLGAFGFWLVIVAAILSMFSALLANLYAASRIARAMAIDHTLPAALSFLSPKRGTPSIAIAVTAVIVCVVLIVLPDVAAAGAASSLVFLGTFALAHWVAILVRQRSGRNPPPFRVPLFPVVPIVGGLSCIGLAIFQAIAVPSAGLIAVVWLSVGGILFLGLFARGARVTDASTQAFDPELATLRGAAPLVLVPIANPRNAEAMVALADALVPANVGRVLLQTVVVAPPNWHPASDPAPFDKLQDVSRELLKASARLGVRTEWLTTVSAHPMEEIARVAQLHRCSSVLLGLSEITEDERGSRLERLLSNFNTDVVVLRSRKDWRFEQVKKICVPVAGRGSHEQLLALLLGSVLRHNPCEVTFLRVVPTAADQREVRRAQRNLKQMADDNIRGKCQIELLTSDDPLTAICSRAEESDLLILGAQRQSRRRKLFGDFTRQIAQRTSCPIVVLSRRG